MSRDELQAEMLAHLRREMEQRKAELPALVLRAETMGDKARARELAAEHLYICRRLAGEV